MDKRALERDELIAEIKRFMQQVGVSDALLYGSRARDDWLHTSDVDLMLISPRFQGQRLLERLRWLHGAWHLWWLYPELLAYTPEEFEEAQQGLGIEREAARTGIRITVAEDQ